MDLKSDTATLEFLRDNLGAAVRHDVEGGGRGQTYFAIAGEIVPCPLPVAPPTAQPIQLSTLTGFCRFVTSNVDELELADHLIVATASSLSLLSAASEFHRHRENLVLARYPGTGIDGLLGKWLPIKVAVANLGVHFEDSADMVRLLELLSDVTIKDARVQKRAGLGFRVTTETGGEGGWTTVENPFFELSPYRSFPEAGAQVPSRYIVDMDIEKPDDDGAGIPVVRVQQADGHGWVPRAAEQVGRAVEARLVELAGEGAELPPVVW